MAKLFDIAKVTVTIDDGDNTTHYTGGTASISGDGHGVNHIGVRNVKFERIVPSKPFAVSHSERKWLDERALCDPPLLDSVVAAAKAQEGQALVSARKVELAVLEEQAKIAEKSHEFNMAVLAYLHAGGTQYDAVNKLQELGIGFPDEVELIADLDVEKLYYMSAEETVSVPA